MNQRSDVSSQANGDKNGSAQPLPPGAGSPLQPGPPMSVGAPIRDTTMNLAAVVTAVVIGVGVIVVVVLLVVVAAALFSTHH